jgi:1,4-alpha-glucan branching enzyme
MKKSKDKNKATPKIKGIATKVNPGKLGSNQTPVKNSGIMKEYLEGKNSFKVTFRLPSLAATDAKTVCLVGDFNKWNIHANPMKRKKNGDYTISLELTEGHEYQFRYLIDGTRWENDWNADKYVESPYGGSDNSVVRV